MGTVIKAIKREPGSQSKLTKIRKNGQLAGVIYGYNTESTPILLDYAETEKMVRKNGHAAIFDIDLDGKKMKAVLTDVQRDAIKGKVKHVDFLAINMSLDIEMDVPFILSGESVGVREGGVLTQPNHTLKLKLNPTDIPETIEIDISQLKIGDTLALGAVRNQFKFEILNEDEYTLAIITHPARSEEVTNVGSEEVAATKTEALEGK